MNNNPSTLFRLAATAMAIAIAMTIAAAPKPLVASASDISIWPFLPGELGTSPALYGLNPHQRFGFVGNPASFNHRRFSFGASHIFTDPIRTYTDDLNGSEYQESLVLEAPLPKKMFWGSALRLSTFSDTSRDEFGQKGGHFTFFNTIAENALAAPFNVFGLPGQVGVGVAYWNSHLRMLGSTNRFLNHNLLFHFGLRQALKNDWTMQVALKNLGFATLNSSKVADPTRGYHVSLRKQMNHFFQVAFDYALLHERGETSSPFTNTISSTLMMDVPLVEPPDSKYSDKRNRVPQIGASVMYSFDIAPRPPPQIGASVYIDLALGKRQAFMRISYGSAYNDFFGYRQSLGSSYHF